MDKWIALLERLQGEYEEAGLLLCMVSRVLSYDVCVRLRGVIDSSFGHLVFYTVD